MERKGDRGGKEGGREGLGEGGRVGRDGGREGRELSERQRHEFLGWFWGHLKIWFLIWLEMRLNF